MNPILASTYFDKPALTLARVLIGKLLRHRVSLPGFQPTWLAARIIETEAYELTEKGSHSSLGYTEKRKAMFMQPGTVYMYYARGAASLNFSAQGRGNAVLIKSAHAETDALSPMCSIPIMQLLNPSSKTTRPKEKLCSGQTLLCKSLDLKVPDWDQQQMDPANFRLEDTGYEPARIIQCKRLGIPAGRDQHLMYRFVDYDYAEHATSNPLRKRHLQQGQDYVVLNNHT